MKTTVITIAVAALALCTAPAQVPSILNYQGRVTVGGTNLTTNAALFKFALVDGSGSTVYWKNDGAVTADEPATAVTTAVAQGLYSTLLGDTSLANMAAIPPSVFTNSDVNLRVWFSPGSGNPFV
ncbi:MAG: galactose oxidase, partial [Chthoniobacterales bacterium]